MLSFLTNRTELVPPWQVCCKFWCITNRATETKQPMLTGEVSYLSRSKAHKCVLEVVLFYSAGWHWTRRAPSAVTAGGTSEAGFRQQVREGSCNCYLGARNVKTPQCHRNAIQQDHLKGEDSSFSSTDPKKCASPHWLVVLYRLI